MMRAYCKTILAAAALLLIIGPVRFPVRAADPASTIQEDLEYKVKAAYLYNFIKFVDWPSESMENTDLPIRICVLGKNPFGDLLSPLEEKRAKDRPLVLESRDGVEEAGDCHVLFISSSESRYLPRLIKRIGKKSILTVGEMKGFAEQGGIIGFVIRDGKVRLEINHKSAKQAGLEVSAKLLEIATIVE